MTTRLGIDVGGTFTDVVWTEDGSIAVEKVPSTPVAPADGVLDGVDAAIAAGCQPESVELLTHGTTVVTNAVLERDWAETALVTNAGFEDVLEIGRQTRPALYDLTAETPPPVIERQHRYGVDCRVDEHGAIEQPLTEDDIETLLDELRETDFESVAVSFLFSYENPTHEQRLQAALNTHTDLSVSISSAVFPEIKEYERTLLTALNAAVSPLMDRYLGRLETGVTDRGIGADLQVMQSTGGVIDAEQTRAEPVRTVLSGPAAGVVGAAYIANRHGREDILSMDMGGTSCDVALVTDGASEKRTDRTIGGYPIALPMVGVYTIGAGGGSIAELDSGGALQVGPASAGADPGPVCYGRGGDAPTVTDAHAILGRIDPTRMLASNDGEPIEAARSVFKRDLADPLDRSVEESAAGLLQVANSNMEQALRVVSVDQGYDPREFALVAFGGAGPVHAGRLADALDIPQVLIPPYAGVLSALGLLVSDLQYEASRSMVRPLAAVAPETLEAVCTELADPHRRRLTQLGAETNRVSTDRRLELRYQGQSFELTVPIPSGEIDAATVETIADRFHEKYRQRYGHATPEVPIELVTVRVRVQGEGEPPQLGGQTQSESVETARVDSRSVWFDGAYRETPVYERRTLPAEQTITGPAVITGPDSTPLLYPGHEATVAADGTLIIDPNP